MGLGTPKTSNVYLVDIPEGYKMISIKKLQSVGTMNLNPVKPSFFCSTYPHIH